MKQLSPTPPGCLYIPIHPPHTPFHWSQALISPTHCSILLKSHSSIEKGQLSSWPKKRCYGMIIHSFWKVISESPLFKIAVQNFRNKTLTTRDLVFHLLWAFSLYEKKSTKPWKTLYAELSMNNTSLMIVRLLTRNKWGYVMKKELREHAALVVLCWGK